MPKILKIKVFGCQNLKNFSLYNNRGIILKNFFKCVVEMSVKRRLYEKIKIFWVELKKLTIKNIREINFQGILVETPFN